MLASKLTESLGGLEAVEAVVYTPWPWEVPNMHMHASVQDMVLHPYSVLHVTHRIKIGQEVLIVQLCFMNCHYSKSWQCSKISIIFIHKLALCSLAAYAQGIEYRIPEAVLPNRRRGGSVLEVLNSLQSLIVLSFVHALYHYMQLACITSLSLSKVNSVTGGALAYR